MGLTSCVAKDMRLLLGLMWTLCIHCRSDCANVELSTEVLGSMHGDIKQHVLVWEAWQA